MYILLVSIVVGLFLAMLFLNIYFRVKVMKSYKIMVQNRVEFNATDIFSKKKVEEEIIPKYPHLKEEITTFSNHLQFSIKAGTGLLALITTIGGIMMWFRHEG